MLLPLHYWKAWSCYLDNLIFISLWKQESVFVIVTTLFTKFVIWMEKCKQRSNDKCDWTGPHLTIYVTTQHGCDHMCGWVLSLTILHTKILSSAVSNVSNLVKWRECCIISGQSSHSFQRIRKRKAIWLLEHRCT